MEILFKQEVLIATLLVITTSFVSSKASYHVPNVSHAQNNILAQNGCNFFQGQWVLNPSLKPPYDPSTCPFVDDEFNCLKFRRPDKYYLQYYWKPDSCSLPTLNGVDFLNKWRGKKIMFVGDSLSDNQWNSLACMLNVAIPKSRTSIFKRTPITRIDFLDYKLSLSLYLDHYLVDLVKEPRGQILKLDSITKGKDWLGMDMLIFNTWHWWTHTGNAQEWDFFQYGNNITKEMNRLEAFTRALTTWANWVDRNIDPAQTKVFFQGISPTHYNGKEWGSTNPNCVGETEPIKEPSSAMRKLAEADVVRKVVGGMKKPVYLLDVTALSQLRKGAHPTKYGTGDRGQDCSHWCLPGLPDTWNQILYAVLMAS